VPKASKATRGRTASPRPLLERLTGTLDNDAGEQPTGFGRIERCSVGFIWYGTLHIGPIPIVQAPDIYRTGEGHMLIKAASLVTVADATGREIDHGEMVRYLSEMMWFPSAFLEDNVSFEADDARSARVILTDSRPDGHRDAALRCRRWAHRLRGAAVRRQRPRNLVGAHTAYREFEGLKLPVQG
jgi:hypothetical protein